MPIQWSDGGAVSSFADKKFVFIYPMVCIVIRYLIRPIFYTKLQMLNHSAMISEYMSNFICFVALSTEVFSILFTYGVVKNIVMLLFVDGVVFIGILLVGLMKMHIKRNGA